MNAVMEDVQSIGKDSENKSQGFKFRGIDAVMNHVGPAFRTHGVVTTPQVVGYDSRDVPTKSGGTMNHVILRVKYIFTGPAGDTLEAEVYGEAADSGDKAMSKAHSVAYRTALLQVLTIPTGDPDPDESTYERGARTAQNGAIGADAPIVKAIYGKSKSLGITDEYLRAGLIRDFGKEHPGDLTMDEAKTTADKLEAKIKERDAQAQVAIGDEEIPF